MRIFFDCLLLLCVLYAPWYAAAALAIVLLFVFDRYYEILFAGLAMDILYNGTVSFGSFQYVMTLSFAVLLALTTFLRSRLKFY